MSPPTEKTARSTVENCVAVASSWTINARCRAGAVMLVKGFESSLRSIERCHQQWSRPCPHRHNNQKDNTVRVDGRVPPPPPLRIGAGLGGASRWPAGGLREGGPAGPATEDYQQRDLKSSCIGSPEAGVAV